MENMKTQIHKAARNRLETIIHKTKREMPDSRCKSKTCYFYEPLYQLGKFFRMII